MSLQPILHSFDYATAYVCEQVADIPDPEMVAQPAGIVNHPAWTLGHLTFACQLLGGTLGLAAWLPAHYAPGSNPAADPDFRGASIGQLQRAQHVSFGRCG